MRYENAYTHQNFAFQLMVAVFVLGILLLIDNSASAQVTTQEVRHTLSAEMRNTIQVSLK
ncbi:MAG: hypothetical protein KBB70_02955 [Candidatus Pacebacteria bacterium]|nr:hypothetical protein [Candidatus Paceibacterota bacterium]